MAGRKKGTQKTGGRKPGTGNKVDTELRARIKQFLDSQFHVIMRDFVKLDPDKRIALYEKLLNYVLAKKTDVTTDGEKIQVKLPDIIIK